MISLITIAYIAFILNFVLQYMAQKDAMLEISISKALLFGACAQTTTYEEGKFNSFQVCFGPIVATLTYEAK